MPFTTKQVVLRVAQEALHNVVKHASATTVTVSARHENQVLHLEVADDGVGFDTQVAYPGHLGLTSMHERITALGGTLSISSTLGVGTSVNVRVPYEPEVARDEQTTGTAS